jgi:hypothetical protein
VCRCCCCCCCAAALLSAVRRGAVADPRNGLPEPRRPGDKPYAAPEYSSGSFYKEAAPVPSSVWGCVSYRDPGRSGALLYPRRHCVHIVVGAHCAEWAAGGRDTASARQSRRCTIRPLR